MSGFLFKYRTASARSVWKPSFYVCFRGCDLFRRHCSCKRIPAGEHSISHFLVAFGKTRNGERKPFIGLNTVLRHGIALKIHLAKVKLRVCVPLVGRPLKPLRGLPVILGQAETVHIGDTEIELRVGITLFGRKTPQAYGLVCIGLDSPPV